MANKRPPPIDRGWAWVILLAAFGSVFLHSTQYISGLYNFIFLEEFGQSKSTTALIGSSHASMIAFLGPFTSVLIVKLGHRKTVFIGSVIAVIGFLSSAFAYDFTTIILTYGIIAGSGVGIIYMGGFVIMGFYFRRYRNIAYGVVTTGAGIGTIVLAPLTNFFIATYGWRGSLIITAGILCHGFVIASVLRPVDFDLEEVQDLLEEITNDTAVDLILQSSFSLTAKSYSLFSQRATDNKSRTLRLSTKSIKEEDEYDEKPKAFRPDQSATGSEDETVLQLCTVTQLADLPEHKAKSDTNLSMNKLFHKLENINLHESSDVASDFKTCNVLSPKAFEELMHKPVIKQLQFKDDEKCILPDDNRTANSIESFMKATSALASRRTSFQRSGKNSRQASIYHTPMVSGTDAMVRVNSFFSRMSADVIADSFMSNSLKASKIAKKVHPDLDKDKDADQDQTKSIANKSIANKSIVVEKQEFSLKLLINRKFIIFCVNLLFVNMGISVVYIHLPAYAIEAGSDSAEAAGLLSVLGFSNILCRMLTGIATNAKDIDILVLYLSTCGISGVILCIGPFLATTHFSRAVMAFVFALYGNCYVIIMSTYTIDLLGINALTVAYGIELFVGAIGYLIGPPLAGLVYDLSGTYLYSIVLGGVSYLIASAILMTATTTPTAGGANSDK